MRRYRTAMAIIGMALALGCRDARVATKSAPDNGAGAADNAANPDSRSPEAIAVVNGREITLAEYKAYLDLFLIESQRNGNLLRKSLMAMINNRIIAAKAVEEGLDKDPFVRGKVGLAVNKVWADAYWTEVVKPTVRVGDEEILKSAPAFKDAVRLYQIVAADPEKARALRERVADRNEPFDVVARAESEGLTAARGGDVGFIDRETPLYVKPVVDRIFAMKAGEISPVVPTDIGYSIYKVAEIRSVAQQRQEWLNRNRESVTAAKGKEIWDRHLGKLKKKHKVVLRDKAGRRFVEAMEKGEDLKKYADKVLLEVDGDKWVAATLVDPSGSGVVHGPKAIEGIIESRLREYLVNADMERLGLKEKFPELKVRERLIRENVLTRQYLERAAGSVRATDADVRKYYKDNPSKFVAPRMLDLSVIEVESRDAADNVYSDLASGKSFAETADRHSRKKETKGGKIGPVDEKRIAARFAAVKSMKPGEISKAPLELTDPKTKKKSYAVFRLDGVVPERRIPLESANRADIEKAVTAIKREEAIARVFEDLKPAMRVELKKDVDDLINRFKTEARTGGAHASPHR